MKSNNLATRNKFSTYVNYGSLFRHNGSIIENPAILVSSETGICKYGEQSMVEQAFTSRMNALKKVGDIDTKLMVVSFDKFELSNNQICAVLNRCLGLADNTFSFLSNLLNSPNDVIINSVNELLDDWLIVKGE